MKESILHYVWQFRLFRMNNLKTTDGKMVEIIHPGLPNTDAGPDFFNAKIKIDDTLWAGNIEIHNQSSDWAKHRHTADKAYDNVILHVVNKADKAVFRTNGDPLPQLELEVPEHIRMNYNELLSGKKWIPCGDKITQVPLILINDWKSALLIERMEQKTEMIETLLTQTNNHWEEAFYVSLARSFGFGTNSQAFERLARSLPMSILAKHKDDIFQLEALLFGQAGLLEQAENDEYHAKLKKEYRFLQTKYHLKPIESSEWKLLRLRPDNFPHVRLAQFAALTHRSSKLFSKTIAAADIMQLRALFDCEVSDYWKKHYLFGKQSAESAKRLGRKSIDILLINTVVPFLFAHSKKKNAECETALKLLELIPSEKNAVVRRWVELGVSSASAFDSQALLHLKKKYCDDKKCLRCRIGHKVLSKSNNQVQLT